MRRTAGLPGTLALATLAAGAVLGAAWIRLGLPLPHCTLKEWTGLPCTTCGTTRLVEALLSGHVLAAATFNPLVFCGLALTTVWGAVSAVRWTLDLPGSAMTLAPRARTRVLFVAAAAVILNWIYLLVRGI